jgi:hypothetical protein
MRLGIFGYMPLKSLLQSWLDKAIRDVQDMPSQVREQRQLKMIETIMNARLARTFTYEDFELPELEFGTIFQIDLSQPPPSHDLAPKITLEFDPHAPRIICNYGGVAQREWIPVPDSFMFTRYVHVDSPPQDRDIGYVDIQHIGKITADELYKVRAEIAHMLEQKISTINPNMIYRFRNTRHVDQGNAYHI